MKNIVTVIIDASSHHSLKSATGSVLFNLSKAMTQTNGASLQFRQVDPADSRAMQAYFSDMAAVANMMPPNLKRDARRGARRTEKRKTGLVKGILGSALSEAKESIMAGLTGDE